jgi:hypothetical protein
VRAVLRLDILEKLLGSGSGGLVNVVVGQPGGQLIREEHASCSILYTQLSFIHSFFLSSFFLALVLVLDPWTLGIKMKRYFDPLRHVPGS